MRFALFAPALWLAMFFQTGLALAQDTEFSVGDLTISHAWARETAPTAKSGGAFLTITNQGDSDDRLIAVISDFAPMAEVHTTENDNGVMRMRHVEAIEVPAGGEASLAPGGDHVMLMGMTEPLVEGTWITLELEFEQAGKVEVLVPVQDIGFAGY